MGPSLTTVVAVHVALTGATLAGVAVGPLGTTLGAAGIVVASRSSRALGIVVGAFTALVAVGTWRVVGGTTLELILAVTTLLTVTAWAKPALAHPPPSTQRAPLSGLPEAEASPLLNAMPDWVVQIDPHLRVLRSNATTNPAFPTVDGRHIGQSIGLLFDEQIREALLENIHRTAQVGRPSTFEYYLLHGAEVTYAEMRVVPDATSIWLISRDITSRRTRQEALKESQERFALAVQGANDGLWDWNVGSGEVYYSHSLRAMLGATKAEFGKTIEDLLSRVHPEDIGRVRRALDRHFEGHSSRYESEHRIRHQNGTWRWVLTRGLAVRDKSGTATRIAGSMIDLTHRRVVAAAAEKSKLLEYATRAVEIGIAMRTEDGKIMDPSPMLESLVSSWDDVGTWWSDVVAAIEWPDPHVCPTCGGAELLGGTRVDLFSPAGDPRVFEITFTGHGHEVQRDTLVDVLLVEDVTDAALAEARLRTLNVELTVARDQALASSRAKSAFLANMSHELRTPLNAIIGYSEMLLEDAVEEGSESVPDLERIHGAGAHLLSLIAGILDLSKVEAGIMQVDVDDIEIESLVQEVRITAEPLRRSNRFEIRNEDPGRVRTDPVKLRQILLNLLNNAFKFTDDGEVVLQVQSDLTHVVFSISDTGIGIDEAQRARLFEEFVQGDLSSTKAFQGAGLGLAIVRRFTSLLGGSITLDSEVGVGSTFQVTIPRDNEDEIGLETLDFDVSPVEADL